MDPGTLSLLVGACCALVVAGQVASVVVIVRAVRNAKGKEITHLTRRADDTWRVLNGFCAENGYSDNYTKTQVISQTLDPKEWKR